MCGTKMKVSMSNLNLLRSAWSSCLFCSRLPGTPCEAEFVYRMNICLNKNRLVHMAWRDVGGSLKFLQKQNNVTTSRSIKVSYLSVTWHQDGLRMSHTSSITTIELHSPKVHRWQSCYVRQTNSMGWKRLHKESRETRHIILHEQTFCG
jgi:hypothetical protein